MAVIYLSHPVHGAKVAISDMEADNDIQNGWSYFDPIGIPPVTAEAPVEPVVEPVNALQPRRRGRRPKESAE